MKKSFPKIGIIGLGTFGKCWLKWLSTSFASIQTYSPDTKESTCSTIEELIQKTEVIFICVPIGKMSDVLKVISPLLTANHLVIDVCSVKMKPVEWMLKLLPQDVRILATHPMFGPQSASKFLKGLNFMYAKVRCVDQDIVWLLDFLQHQGVAVVEMTPEEHDLQAARTQALSFFVGHVLNQVGLPKTPIDTTQYQTLARFSAEICEDTPELFNDMLKYNPYSKEVIKHFFMETGILFKEKFPE